MTDVWDPKVVKLLANFGTKYGDNPKGREAYLDDVLEALTTRDAIWGALMNYPRTVVVTPGESFNYTWKAGILLQPLNWETTMQSKMTTLGKNLRDVDQIVWLNHCANTSAQTTRGMSRGSMSDPTIEIGLIRMNHEAFAGGEHKATLGAARFVGGGKNPKAKDFVNPVDGNYKTVEAKAILAYVFGTAVANNVDLEREKNAFKAVDESNVQDKGHLYYLKNCAVVLEYVMRNRTSLIATSLTATAEGHVTRKIMHTAVSARQVPYALVDLDADKGQPPVMPGKTSIDEIVGVLKNVVGYGEQGFSGSRPHYGTLFDETSSARSSIHGKANNPYDSLIGNGFSDDEDDENLDVFAGGELSPFSCSEDEYGY